MSRQGQSPQRLQTGQKQRKKKKKKGGQQPKPIEDKEEQLRYLQEVFKDHIEPTLVHSIFEDYNADVTKVLETLASLADADSQGDADRRQIPSFKDITDHLTRQDSDSDDDSGQLEEGNGHDEDEDRGNNIPQRISGDHQPTGNDSSLDLPLLPKEHRDELDSPGSVSRRRDENRDGHGLDEQKSPLSYHNVRYDDHDTGLGVYHGTETLDSLLAGARDTTHQYGYGNVQAMGYHPAGGRTVDDILAEAGRTGTTHSEHGNGAYVARHSTTTETHNVNTRYHYNGPSQPAAGTSAHHTTASASANIHGHPGQFGGNNYISTYYGAGALRQPPLGGQQGHPPYAGYTSTTVPGGLTYNQFSTDHRWSTQEKASNLRKPVMNNSHRDRAPVGQESAPREPEAGTRPQAWPHKRTNIIPSDRSRPREVTSEFEPLPGGKVLCLMRGVPGSGKSTLARQLLPSRKEGRIISTDDYFRRNDGTYIFNPSHLDKAHERAQWNAERSMERGVTPIIIDNTNTMLWEMKVYVQLAQKYHYKVEVREPNTPWKTKAAECARRNAHDVPPEKIQRMLDRFEPLRDVESILRAQDKKRVMEKRSNQDARKQGARNDHNRPKYHSGRSGSPHVPEKPKDVNVRIEETAVLGQSVPVGEGTRENRPRFTPIGGSFTSQQPKVVSEELLIATTSQSESSQPMEELVAPDSKSGSGGSVTRSNLSEIESVITSVPLASNLQERMQSLQDKLTEFGDFGDMRGSSGELLSGNRVDMSTGQNYNPKTDDEVLGKDPPLRQTSTDQKNKVIDEDASRKNPPKLTNPRENKSGPKQQFPVTNNIHESSSSEDDRLKYRHSHRPSGTSSITVQESGYGKNTDGPKVAASPFASKYLTHSEPLEESTRHDKYRSGREEERLPGSGAPRAARPLKASEAGLDSHEPGMGGQRSSRSEAKSSGSRYESAKHVEKSTGTGARIEAMQHGTPSSSRVVVGSEPEVEEHLTKKRSETAHIEPESRIRREEQESPHHRNDGLPDGWEAKGAKPKVNRAVSEPFRPLVAEDPGPRPFSPVRDAQPAPFRSLATVPQMKKRQRRAGTPIGRRCLAANFSTPALPTVPEPAKMEHVHGERTRNNRDKSDEMHRLRASEELYTAAYRESDAGSKKGLLEGTSLDHRQAEGSLTDRSSGSEVSTKVDDTMTRHRRKDEHARTDHVQGTGSSSSKSNVLHRLRSREELYSTEYGESDARSRERHDHIQGSLPAQQKERKSQSCVVGATTGVDDTSPSHRKEDGTSSPTPIEETSKTKEQTVKRKVARSGRAQSPPPLLSPETKQKALTQNWGLNAITKEVVPAHEAFPRESAPHDLPETKNHTSQTDPTHFEILDRVNVSLVVEPTGLGNLRMVQVSPVPWRVEAPIGQIGTGNIPFRRKIDKSSMTDEELTQDISLKALCDIFPQMRKDEIKDLLDRCGGNLEIASELLLQRDSRSESARERRRREKAEQNPIAMTDDRPKRDHDRMAPNESQTTRSDFLLARLIKDGYQADIPAGMTVVNSRYWISMSAPGGEGASKSERHPHVIQKDFGATAEFEDAMPDFDANLSKLLLAHKDVPFLDVCNILEENRGDVDKAEREIIHRYSEKGEAGHQDSYKVPKSRYGDRHGDIHGAGPSDQSMTGGSVVREGRWDRRPEPLGQPLTSESLNDEEKASLSDQESRHLQRGRSVQSERGSAQAGSAMRRTRSVPRRRPQSPRPETRTKDDHRLPQNYRKQLRTPESMMTGLSVEKNDVRRAEGKKQLRPSGLGRHLAGGEDRLPSRYSLYTQKKRDGRGGLGGASTAQEGGTGRRGTERAEDLLKAGKTPLAEQLAREGEGVLTTRAQGGRPETPQHLTKDRQKGQDGASTSPSGAHGGVAIPGVTEGEEKSPAALAKVDVGRGKSERSKEKVPHDHQVQDEDSRKGRGVAPVGPPGAQGGEATLDPREGRRKHLDAPPKADKGRATPADLLDEAGKGVPARFHAGMTFQLDMAFALQLQEIFGSVGFNIDTDVLDEADLAVSVDLELAKTLHTAWSESFRQKFDREEKQLMQMMKQDVPTEDDQAIPENSKQKAEREKKKLEMMKQDEALAKQLQREERKQQLKELKKAKHREQAAFTGSPVRGYSAAAAPQRQSPMGVAAVAVDNLQEIMDTEMAQQMSGYLEEEDVADKGSTMAVNIRRNQLREKYPGTDESWLENIFMINNFDFEATVKSVDAQVGATTPPRNVFSAEALQREEERRVARAMEESQTFEPVEAEERNQIEADELEKFKSGNFQSLGHPGYRDYRAEANQHYQQRQECFRKASEAFRNGQKDQAAHYSQQGHKHTALLQEANQRAGEAILADTNKERDTNTIDLHGLHVDEAIPVLQKKIEDLRLTLTYANPYVHTNPHLEIITGRGNNSKGGIARIKPAVINYLKTKGIRYEHLNQGLLRIKVM